MLQLNLSDKQFHYTLRCHLYQRFYGNSISWLLTVWWCKEPGHQHSATMFFSWFHQNILDSVPEGSKGLWILKCTSLMKDCLPKLTSSQLKYRYSSLCLAEIWTINVIKNKMFLLPGNNPIAWLGDFSQLAPLPEFLESPYGETDNKSPFPVRPVDRRSYAQNCVVWIKPAGIQVGYNVVLL